MLPTLREQLNIQFNLIKAHSNSIEAFKAKTYSPGIIFKTPSAWEAWQSNGIKHHTTMMIEAKRQGAAILKVLTQRSK